MKTKSQDTPSAETNSATAGGSATVLVLIETVTIKPRAKKVLAVGGAAILLIACVAAVMIFRFGSFSAATAFLGGDRLLVSPGSASFGERRADETSEVAFRIENLTRKPVRIVGATWSCTCMSTNDLPLEIPPGERRKVAVDVRPTPKISGTEQRVTFFTDCPDKPVMTVQIVGIVVE